MKVSWADKMIAKGRVEGEALGLRRALRRYLERQFGSLPEAIGRRLDAIDDAETLERLSDRAFDGATLDELGLA